MAPSLIASIIICFINAIIITIIFVIVIIIVVVIVIVAIDFQIWKDFVTRPFSSNYIIIVTTGATY